MFWLLHFSLLPFHVLSDNYLSNFFGQRPRKYNVTMTPIVIWSPYQSSRNSIPREEFSSLLFIEQQLSNSDLSQDKET